MYSCIQCNKWTIYKCDICGTSHCSDKCRQENAACHQVVCHPRLYQRVKSAIDYVIDGGVESFGVSSWFYKLNNKSGQRFNLSPYGKPSKYGHCVFCAEICSNWNMAIRGTFYRKINITYYTCRQCESMKKELCLGTFADIKECTKNTTDRLVMFVACLKRTYPTVPKDIRRLILSKIEKCDHSSD